MQKNSGKVLLKVTNSLPTPRILMLEPWTGEYSLPAGKTLDVVAVGDLSQPLEIEMFEDRIIIYGFDSAESMLTVYDQGRQLKSYPHGGPAT